MRRIRSLLLDDAGLKLVSLVIAAGIWARVSLYGAEEVEQTYTRPIQIENVEPGLTASPIGPDAMARITVVGPRRAHLALARRLKPYVDLKNIKSPLGVVTLKVETNTVAEPGVEIAVVPGRLDVVVKALSATGP